MSKIFGVGIVDVPRPIDRKLPFYQIWQDMLRRCYSIQYHKSNPTYQGCQVCDEWLQLSNFWSWAETGWEAGYQLDKDIIKPGNKIYHPDYCRFVPRALNSLLNDMRNRRGKYPLGVCFQVRFKPLAVLVGR